ncbi:MAG TPA: VCBS repeat-containing protein [Solirubrobacteraceae bacterium]|nr:VCBS repeat-containing protein [Solirubrobacteraceae bacterium]
MRLGGSRTVGGLAGVALACAATAGAVAQTPPTTGNTVGNDPGTQTPTVRPDTPEKLIDALCSGFQGTIVVPQTANWRIDGPCPRPEHRLTDYHGRAVPAYERAIPIRSNVQLVGERGFLASRPTVYSEDTSVKRTTFAIVGNNVSVRGIHFDGRKPYNQNSTDAEFVDALTVAEDPETKQGRNILIADNEFEGWSHAGVSLTGIHGNAMRADYDRSWARLLPSDAGLVRIENNYMHHNTMDGGGYGVVVAGGAYGHIEGNVFDTNRHAVAGTGRAYSGYIARHNYVLQGGVKQSGYWNQHFDMHGEPVSGYGGSAGYRFEISFNTIRGEQEYSCFVTCLKTRPALMLRGKTLIGAYFNGNVAVHDDLDEAVSLKDSKYSTGIGEDHDDFNFHAAGNRFDVDYSTEIAAGDFDGDGRDDVFLANGTAWFYSRAGVREWQYLRPSNKRIHELGLADVDNDGVTDVLWRDGGGRVGYVKSGRGALLPLTGTPVGIRELRFGDFDGDSKTDIFYTRRDQWHVWYGATRQWREVGSSSKSIAQLLFGEFDAVRGTDVVGINGDGWAYSSAATSPWARMNRRLTSNFDRAVAGDFGGDGRSDIAVSDGQKWRWSLDGRGELINLRNGASSPRHKPLKQLLIGKFETHDRDLVISFDGLRLYMWGGIGTLPAFRMRSEEAMR